jgi:hypothetical protein
MTLSTLDQVAARTGRAERRQITVLSSELVSAANTDPEDVANQLAGYRRDVANVASRHGGQIIAEFGANMLVVWGASAPVAIPTAGHSHTWMAAAIAGPDGPRSAILAALDLVARDTCQSGSRATIQVAVDAGIVVVNPHTASGLTGGPGAAVDDLVGQVLSDAQHLRAEACGRCVLVSDAVRQLTAEAFVFEPARQAKTWTVTACKPMLRWHDRRAPRLIGNTHQQALLARLLTAVQTRGQHIVVVTGEAGIGKSTLFHHFRVQVRASKARWIEATCRAEHTHATLQPIRDLLRTALPRGSIAWLTDATQQFPAPLPDLANLNRQDRQLLARFLNADGRSPPLSDSDGAGPAAIRPAGKRTMSQNWPLDGQQRLVNLLIELLCAMAKLQPTILAIEDLHWADGETLAFLGLLVDRSVRWQQFGLALVARRADQLPAQVLKRSTIVEVQRLSDREIIQLLTGQQQIGAPPAIELPRQVLALIAQRADGVPLFAEQLAALYLNTADPAQASAVLTSPTSLNLTLAARLDALGADKSLAQAAAVLGRDFERAVLADMLAMPPAQLQAGLAALEASGLIMPVNDRPHVSHRFSHALVRDAAYASLLKQRRRDLHARAADAITTRCPGLAQAMPEAMALHYSEAGDRIASAHWWRQSAAGALDLSQLTVAVAHLQRGLALLDGQASTSATHDEELAIRRMLGPCLTMLAGNGADAVLANYRRCLVLADTPTAAATPTFEILWGLQCCHAVRGEMTEALVNGEQAIATAEATARTDLSASSGIEQCLLAHRMQGLIRLQTGDIATAIGHYREVERRYDPDRHESMRFRYASDQGVLAQAHWAWAEAVAGNLEASEQHAAAALARAGQLAHPHTSAHVVAVLAARAQTLRQRDVAAPLALAARTLGQTHGFTYWTAWAEIILGWHEGARSPELSIARIDRAIQDYRRTGAGQALPFALLLKAEIAVEAGMWEIAARTAAEGLLLARSAGLGLYMGELLRVRALALIQAAGHDVRADGPQRCATRNAEADAALADAMTVCVAQGTLVFAMRAALTQLNRHGHLGRDAAAGSDPVDRQAHAVLRQSLGRLLKPNGPRVHRQSTELAAAISILGASGLGAAGLECRS